MDKKKSTTIFAVVAIILFILGMVTTGVAVKEGNAFKTANATYNLYAKSEISLGASNLSANTESAKTQRNEHKDNFKKYFAISILIYVALVIMLLLIYLNTIRAEEIEKKQE